MITERLSLKQGLLLVALIVPGLVLTGFTVSQFWLWFIVPTFKASPLSLPAATGISLIVQYVVYQPPPQVENYSDVVMRGFTQSLIRPLFYLFLGWLVFSIGGGA